MKSLSNKKGFLLGEETIKIIIAIICVVFLVALVIGLYNNFSKNKDMAYAKSSLDHLISSINAKETQVEIYNPSGWHIASFPQTLVAKGGSTMPKACSSVGWTNCICIYNLQGSFFGVPNAADSADKEGICQQSDFVVSGASAANTGGLGGGTYILTDGIVIQKPPILLSINYSNKTIQAGTGKVQFTG